ncbi:MAG: NRDE family protein [Bacteroidota bacterium]
MCLILFAYKVSAKYPLVLAANRDEFYNRPTARMDWWERKELLAGKDLKGGGTWLGLTQTGKFASLTNYREGAQNDPDAPTRGTLALDYLQNQEDVEAHFAKIAPKAFMYNGFNLLLGELENLYYYSNRDRTGLNRVEPGIHGLSNHLMNTPWHKVAKGKKRLERIVGKRKIVNKEALFRMLKNRETAPDDSLPETGIPYIWEKRLSSMFIESEIYGTRVSTVVMVDKEGNVEVEERAYYPKGEPVQFQFHI